MVRTVNQTRTAFTGTFTVRPMSDQQLRSVTLDLPDVQKQQLADTFKKIENIAKNPAFNGNVTIGLERGLYGDVALKAQVTQADAKSVRFGDRKSVV